MENKLKSRLAKAVPGLEETIKQVREQFHQRIIEAVRAGDATYRDIAIAHGTTEQTVSTVAKKAGIQRRPRVAKTTEVGQ